MVPMRCLSLLFIAATALMARAAEPRRAGPDWWSLQAIARPVVPVVADLPTGANPVDAFVRAKLSVAGLKPTMPAEP